MSLDSWDHTGKIKPGDFRPVGDMLLVEMLETKRTKAGLLLVGKAESAECAFARVVATGPGSVASEDGTPIPCCAKAGDGVLLMDYAGERIQLADGKYRFVRDHGIWARLEYDKHGAATACHPVQDKVILRFDKEEKSLGGRIHLPSNPQTRFARAVVVSVGPGMQNGKTGAKMPMSVEAGQRVIASRYAGAIIKVNGEPLRIMQNMDLEAVFDGDLDVVASGGAREAQDAGRVRDEADGLKMVAEGEAKLASHKGGWDGR